MTPPAVEPVTLDEAKAHLREDTADEDALIMRLVTAAREEAERHTGCAFITQSWTLWRDAWPENAVRALSIPRPPLISVSSVAVYDRSGAQNVLSNDLYIVDSVGAPGRVVLKSTTVLSADLREVNAIAVAFDAGYGTATTDVPDAVRTAILHIVAHLHEARGERATAPPTQALALLAPFRVIAL